MATIHECYPFSVLLTNGRVACAVCILYTTWCMPILTPFIVGTNGQTYDAKGIYHYRLWLFMVIFSAYFWVCGSCVKSRLELGQIKLRVMTGTPQDMLTTKTPRRYVPTTTTASPRGPPAPVPQKPPKKHGRMAVTTKESASRTALPSEQNRKLRIPEKNISTRQLLPR